MDEKLYFLGMTLAEIKEAVKELDLPQFTAAQIADWVYVKRVTSIDEMSNISLKNRGILKSRFDIGRVNPLEVQTSTDGTKKMLFATHHNNKFIEAVTIPENDRLTLCVSSQIGCKMACEFCLTGRMGFSGNLSTNEILNQMYAIPEAENLSNIVFMGMGEPLDNYDHVMKAIEILTADYALAWSPRRITLSTIGILPKLNRFLEESSCHLAISLHSPLSEQRQLLMPAEKAYPIEQIIDLLHNYDWTHQRRLSFEYIMFAGVNDSPIYARRLAKLLSGLNCRINLIRFHAFPESSLQSSDEETMIKFRDYLTSKGFICTIRASRGEDIFAACGMLSTMKKTGNKKIMQ